MRLTPLLILSISNQLRALSGWLHKAEAFAADRGDDSEAMLALRLAPDMFPLTTQLRFVAFQAQEPVYRLRARLCRRQFFRFGRRGVTAGKVPARGHRRPDV